MTEAVDCFANPDVYPYKEGRGWLVFPGRMRVRVEAVTLIEEPREHTGGSGDAAFEVPFLVNGRRYYILTRTLEGARRAYGLLVDETRTLTDILHARHL